MPISIVCSHCQKKLKVADAAAGKNVRCPACKGVLAIPQAEEFVEPDELVEPDEETAVSNTSPKPKKKAAWDDDDDSSEKASPAEEKEEYGFSEEEPKKKKKRRRDYDDDDDEDEEEEERPRRRRRRRRRDDDYARSGSGTTGRGITILVLGILALVFSCAPIFAWILGAIALNMANADLARMETRGMDRSGEGLTKTGKALAIVGIGLGVIFFFLNCGLWMSQRGGPGKF
jgi:hypothetical protein